MKDAPKGPFARIRWFCRDGTLLPPGPYACAPHGGGVQHGERNQRAQQIREAGYLIANILADIDSSTFLEQPDAAQAIKQIILEQFLIAANDGWIFRHARTYRGALQAESESLKGRWLLLEMLQDPQWRSRRFTLLREAARWLPHMRETSPLTGMRELSSAIAEQDTNFERLRNEIHVKPSAAMAEQVRKYAAQRGKTGLTEDYARLADSIKRVYTADPSAELAALASGVNEPQLTQALQAVGKVLGNSTDPAARLAASAGLLAKLRDALSEPVRPWKKLGLLDASLSLELEVFAAGNALRERLQQSPRRERLTWLEHTNDALYGMGLISARQRQALQDSFATLRAAEVSLETYSTEVNYLARVPEWADRGLRFHFARAVEHWTNIEPLAEHYLTDRLRGSPLLFYAAVADSLVEDANRLTGIRHELFGEAVGPLLRPLNPGLARGPLKVGRDQPFDPEGIYILSATTADLPPVSGILTTGEGNALSHVQLLARNLGIPNVVVNEQLLPRLKPKEGQRVVLAASRAGAVRMYQDDPSWERFFGSEQPSPELLIRPDLTKLDLSTTDPIPLSRLRAADSGRSVGPKAAHLGELMYHFPGAVADGLVIPFGAFRTLLDQPIEAGGLTVFEWMKAQYRMLERLRGNRRAHQRAVRGFLARLSDWVAITELDIELRHRLRLAMAQVFGPDGSYGVFVRSDTNVEDLPNFTGAGLNLTVPHVVGFDNVLQAIVRVWASPFSERAFAWRQAHMANPEHVYPSVLLMRSVPVEKSGVMVTMDVDSGSDAWLSVAINEGIGGAVEGQAAEELRIDKQNGRVRLLAQASAPLKRVLRSAGGLAKVPASGSAAVLTEPEIARLVALAHELPEQFPALRGANNEALAADVEFGFHQGELALFQIRPFVQSARAKRSRFLSSLDQELSLALDRPVDLGEIPLRTL